MIYLLSIERNTFKYKLFFNFSVNYSKITQRKYKENTNLGLCPNPSSFFKSGVRNGKDKYRHNEVIVYKATSPPMILISYASRNKQRIILKSQ